MADSAQTLLVIGGGPGGYVAAIRAAQLGAKVTLIENQQMGGTCLNRGCVPTKFLLQAAGMLHQATLAEKWGIYYGKPTVDYAALALQKKSLIDQLTDGIGYLMKKNRISVLHGTARFLDQRRVQVLSDAPATLSADRIILATGSRPAVPSLEGADDAQVITSDDALALTTFPETLTIVGGGYIGVEFAQIFNRFGTRTTLVEMQPQLLPGEDAHISRLVERFLVDEGITVHTGATARSIGDQADGDKVVRFDTTKGPGEAICHSVLMAVGRQPNHAALDPEAAGIVINADGGVAVDDYLRTRTPGIYAVGDVLGRAMLAHAAMAEGICAAENALGAHHTVNYAVVPRCVYTSPAVAAVGLTEAQAKARYGAVKIGRSAFSANSKARIEGQPAGLVKIVAEAKYEQVVGVSMVGPQATELIGQAGLAIGMEATLDELAGGITAHPTLSEALCEAAFNAQGRGVHA